MLKEERCQNIITILQQQKQPVSASNLATTFQVSRQVIVQDIALLRAQAYPILSTARGYVLQVDKGLKHVIEVVHQDDDIEAELQTIVDLGGQVLDVFVEHKTYGKVIAPLPIKSRKDIVQFLQRLQQGESKPLTNITAGHHYHTILVDDEESLTMILEALQEKGFLV